MRLLEIFMLPHHECMIRLINLITPTEFSLYIDWNQLWYRKRHRFRLMKNGGGFSPQCC